jgi:hypothetical protein
LESSDDISTVGYDIGGCTCESDRHGSDFGCDVVQGGDSCRIDETILSEGVVTGTFFSLMSTTQSIPLMATAVSPQVLTALKAYSTWVLGWVLGKVCLRG